MLTFQAIKWRPHKRNQGVSLKRTQQRAGGCLFVLFRCVLIKWFIEEFSLQLSSISPLQPSRSSFSLSSLINPYWWAKCFRPACLADLWEPAWYWPAAGCTLSTRWLCYALTSWFLILASCYCSISYYAASGHACQVPAACTAGIHQSRQEQRQTHTHIDWILP